MKKRNTARRVASILALAAFLLALALPAAAEALPGMDGISGSAEPGTSEPELTLPLPSDGARTGGTAPSMDAGIGGGGWGILIAVGIAALAVAVIVLVMPAREHRDEERGGTRRD